MAVTIYLIILLSVFVAITVTAVLFLLAYRIRIEKTFVGFTRLKDEMYIGFALIVTGFILIIISISELILLLSTSGFGSVPFGFTDFSIAGQSVSGRIIGLSYGILFWLVILYFGGKKFVVLGLDLIKGKKGKLRLRN